MCDRRDTPIVRPHLETNPDCPLNQKNLFVERQPTGLHWLASGGVRREHSLYRPHRDQPQIHCPRYEKSLIIYYSHDLVYCS